MTYSAAHDRMLLRRAKVAELRAEEEASVREIAAKLGIGAATAARDVLAVRAEAAKKLEINAEIFLARELDELSDIQAVALEITETSDDHTTRLQALDRRLKVSTERRKLLGIDAPDKIEAKVDQGQITPAVVAERVRAKFGKVTPKLDDDVDEGPK